MNKNQAKTSIFEDKKFAQIYDHRLINSKSYKPLFQFLDNYLKDIKIRNITDIGAGTGIVSKYLADKNYHVTSIEPSKAMLNVLKSKLQSYPNCKIINKYFEDINKTFFELSLFVHSIYGMKPLNNILDKITKTSIYSIIVIKGKNTFTLTDFLKEYFNIKNNRPTSLLNDITSFFDKKMITYKVNVIYHENEYKINNLEDEIYFQSKILDLSPDRLLQLKQILLKNQIYLNRYEDVIIII